jgi:hypothetical protein
MHKRHCLSLLVAGFASIAAGCQPEEPMAFATGTRETRAAALEGVVGTWSANASQVTSTDWRRATLLDSGLVLVVHDGPAELYNPYSDTWRVVFQPVAPGPVPPHPRPLRQRDDALLGRGAGAQRGRAGRAV